MGDVLRLTLVGGCMFHTRYTLLVRASRCHACMVSWNNLRALRSCETLEPVNPAVVSGLRYVHTQTSFKASRVARMCERVPSRVLSFAEVEAAL